jgi:hypothetical protein
VLSGQPDQCGAGGERQCAAGRAGHQHERAQQHRGHDRDLDQPSVEVSALQALRAGGERPGKLRVLDQELAFDLTQGLPFVIIQHNAPPSGGRSVWRASPSSCYLYRNTIYRDTI